MRFSYTPILPGLLILLAIICGCASRQPVRHLASDACLITPDKTSKQEITAYFGSPDKKQTASDGSEEWFYLQQNKSLLRKTPYVGSKLGSEAYDVMVLTLRGDTVTSCQYRMFSEEEFKQTNIGPASKPDAD